MKDPSPQANQRPNGEDTFTCVSRPFHAPPARLRARSGVVRRSPSRSDPGMEETMRAGHVLDPVCGMWIEAGTAAAGAEHAGATYFFCDPGCRDTFVSDPARYAGPGSESEAGSPGILTARSKEARSCPACGGRVELRETVQERVGDLPLDEFVALVRARWRRRLGRRSYRREHSPRLIRALVSHALDPASPIRAMVVDEELTLEVARLRADGLNRAQIRRELYHLANVAAEILARSGLEAARAAPMVEAIDRRVTAAMPELVGR